jgi:small-conductance mechanosensitive channel
MWETIKTYLLDPTVERLVFLLAGLIVVFVVAGIIKHRIAVKIKDADARYRVRKSVTLASYLAVIILAAAIFSDKLGGIAVVLGVAGAGIAFALQEVITSVAGWLAISIGHFYKTGDRVELGGIKGDVIDIGIIRTTLMELGDWTTGDRYNGRVVRVANSFVFKSPVFNYSGDFPFLWDEVKIPIKYGSDYKLARETINRVLDETVGDYAETAAGAWREMVKTYRIEDAIVKPIITMVFNDNWIEFTARYVVDYKKRLSTKDLLFERILDALAETKGKVAIASTTVQLVDWPELKLETRPDEKSG